MLFQERKNTSNFITKQNPFRSTNGATTCVADVPPIENNQDYGAPYPCNSLSQHCGAAGDLQLLFRALKNSFALDPIFSTVSDVPSRPCSPDVQHHPGHRIHSDHLDAFLNITGRDFWAIAVRRCVPVLRNVAQRHYHPHYTTHPKVGPDAFMRSMHHFRCTEPSTLHPYIYQAHLSGGWWHFLTIHRENYSQSPVSDVGTRFHLHCFCRPRGTKPEKAAKPTREIDGCNIE